MIICALSSYLSAKSKVIRVTSALLKRLSLNAPRNCVRKSGAKRRVRKSENCDFMSRHLVLFLRCAFRASLVYHIKRQAAS